MNQFSLDNHSASFLPEGKQWKLVWHDEFDGTELDTTKWDFRRNFWGKPFPAFTDQGIELDGKSSLRINLVKNPDGTYSSAHLQTGSLSYDIPKDCGGFWPFGKMEEPKFMHTFGYYEIRCRQPKCEGWHSAFWLQAPGIGSHPDARFAGVECDIMENYRQHTEKRIIGGNIWGGYGCNCKGSGHFSWEYKETEDGWHYYGVDWSPSGYDFYADGRLIGRVVSPERSAEVHVEKDVEGKNWLKEGSVSVGPVSHVPQFILVSTECHGYRSAGVCDPVLAKAVLPDYFEVDHVRVFDDVNLKHSFSVAGNVSGSDELPVFMF